LGRPERRRNKGEVRTLDETLAKGLHAGADHYMAYVGPPRQYDFMGATQFRLLCSLGLRDDHRVLDFGCGSLRAGRLLIPYLLPGGYFAIEPNQWLVEEAIEKQLGTDMIRLKRPTFSHSEEFTATVFEVNFDFIVAQSIFSHAGPSLVARALKSFADRLKPKGVCLVTFIEDDDAVDPQEGWKYPGCISYKRDGVSALIADAGLVGMRLSWFHPRQQWYLLARNDESLPSRREARLLHGAVLRDPEFAESVEHMLSLQDQSGRRERRRERNRQRTNAVPEPDGQQHGAGEPASE
jgi:SAM-dependent methyltransferase